MAQFEWTNQAVEDLSNIWGYTFEVWSETQTDKYYQMLISNCQENANNLGLGKSYARITQAYLG